MAAKKKTTTRVASTTTKKSPASRTRRTKTAESASEADAFVDALHAEGDDGLVEGSGAALVIVESPAKAKTIEKYLKELGRFHVEASKGHIRDLPEKAAKKSDAEKAVRKPAKKGEKKAASTEPKPMDIPGVDMETFATTYVVTPDRRETVTRLRKLRKGASAIWFATDLDREGEAISWHIAEVLDVKPELAKRVVFNAITKSAIREAFEHPRPINMSRVNAQNSRRILDRVVGYGISPLLWRLMRQGGLSAGRVQTVAARLVVEREQEIREFIPDESWEVLVRLTPEQSQRAALAKAIDEFLARRNDREKAPSQKDRVAFLSKSGVIEAKLVAVGGKEFDVGAKSSTIGVNGTAKDLSLLVKSAVEAAGLEGVRIDTREDIRGKGAARFQRTVSGTTGVGVAYTVSSIETERKTRRPMPPFKTSTMQMAASSQLGFSTDRTMRIAQQLYEGIDLGGDRVGLITYMRTDSTNVAGEALHAARDHIKNAYGDAYLPEKPHFYASGKDAQEAHEAIRPTDPWRTPQSVRKDLSAEQYALYELIWRRFVACQMAPKVYELTTVRFERSDRPTGAIVRASGSVVVFDGYLKLVEDIVEDDTEATFPKLAEKQVLAAVSIDALQRFSAPPARYSEASLVKELEARGIGRPSTYASIVNTIESRGYVEQKARRFFATALGEAVVSLLIGGFPLLFDYEYTRLMEERLDRVEKNEEDWRALLREIKSMLEGKALDDSFTRMREVPLWRWTKYACPKCGKRAKERVGGGRWFLSCSGYPDCDFASRLNELGEPVSDVALDMVCPVDGSAMVLRSGKFGKYISSVNYPAVKFVVRLDKKDKVVLPSAPPLQDPSIVCTKCGKPCNIREGKRGPWLGCSGFPKCRGRGDWKALGEQKQKELLAAIAVHAKANAPAELQRRDGRLIEAGVPVGDLILPESVVVLPTHPDADKPIEGVGAISPYRAAEAIAEPFVGELRKSMLKRVPRTDDETA
jgi:DNA topoisomerase-1